MTQPPAPASTMRAYRAVERSVREWSDRLDDAEAAGEPPMPWGACIHLRLHGALIGRGTAFTPPDRLEPDADVVARALAAAIRAADSRLPLANDLQRAEGIRQLTPHIQISLELAGEPVPLLADSWTLLDTTLAPGLDGVIAQSAGGDARIEFPSTMMMANSLPQKAIRGLAAGAIGDGGAAAVLDPPKDLREKHEVRMWRFRVSHLAQCEPGAGPEFLYRGARLRSGVPDREELRRMAGALASHIIQRSDDGPPDTRALSQALAACALSRYDDWRRRDRYPPQPWLPIAKDAALSLYCRSAAAAARTDDPATVALLALTVVLPIGERCPGQSGHWSPDPVVRHVLGLDDRLNGQPASVRALLSLAVVPHVPTSSTTTAENQSTIRLAELGLRGIDSARLVSAMPWYGWSQIRLERFRREIEAIDRRLDRRPLFSDLDTQIPPRDLPAAVALRQMRAEVWKHQLSELDAGDEGADLVGGIVFTSGDTSPLPTWQCVRPLAFIATMLGDPRLTEPHERAIELARLLKAFRFLRQLQIDQSVGWMHPAPDSVVGGLRAAAWDHTTPPDATSLALLAVCELLRSLDKFDGDPPLEPAPPR